jgi:hypothetical protein
MKLKIEDDDVVIRRATNGWIVNKISLFEPEHFVTLVYEDDGSPMGEAEAFARMVREVFPDIVQSKKRGGISLDVKEHGYSYSDDGGNTPERIEEQIDWLESVVEEK